MMSKIVIILMTAFTLGAGIVNLQAEDGKDELAERLLAAMKIEQRFASSDESIDRSMDSMKNSMKLLEDLPDSPERRKSLKLMKNLVEQTKDISSQFDWDSLKPKFVQIYSDAFTEKQLKGFVKFYKSDVGTKLVESEPVIGAKRAKALMAGRNGKDSSNVPAAKLKLAKKLFKVMRLKEVEGVNAEVKRRAMSLMDKSHSIAAIGVDIKNPPAWDELEPTLARIYCETFSTDEIKKLGRFYSSPLGRELAGKQPLINKKIAEIMLSASAKVFEAIQQLVDQVKRGETSSVAEAPGKERGDENHTNEATVGDYSFTTPSGVTFKEQFGQGSFKWGSTSFSMMFLPRFPAHSGTDETKMIKKMNAAFVETMSKNGKVKLISNEKIKKGVFTGEMFEYEVKSSLGPTLKMVRIFAKDEKSPSRLLHSNMTSLSGSKEDLAKAYAILESGKRTKSFSF